MTNMYFLAGIAVGAIATMIFWVCSERNLKFLYDFKFREDQKCRIKEIINQFYNPEICDICNRYGGIQGGTDFTPPFKSCIGRKDLEYIKKAQE